MDKYQKGEISRRDFIKATGLATLSVGSGVGLINPTAVQAKKKKKEGK